MVKNIFYIKEDMYNVNKEYYNMHYFVIKPSTLEIYTEQLSRF